MTALVKRDMTGDFIYVIQKINFPFTQLDLARSSLLITLS